MRTMTPTERSYVAGIIDGEGSIEYTQRDRIRHDRPENQFIKFGTFVWKFLKWMED